MRAPEAARGRTGWKDLLGRPPAQGRPRARGPRLPGRGGRIRAPGRARPARRARGGAGAARGRGAAARGPGLPRRRALRPRGPQPRPIDAVREPPPQHRRSIRPLAERPQVSLLDHRQPHGGWTRPSRRRSSFLPPSSDPPRLSPGFSVRELALHGGGRIEPVPFAGGRKRMTGRPSRSGSERGDHSARRSFRAMASSLPAHGRRRRSEAPRPRRLPILPPRWGAARRARALSPRHPAGEGAP